MDKNHSAKEKFLLLLFWAKVTKWNSVVTGHCETSCIDTSHCTAGGTLAPLRRGGRGGVAVLCCRTPHPHTVVIAGRNQDLEWIQLCRIVAMTGNMST